ncbi:hypothetical protein GUITHDRAFT_114233 [Guillardia theta CCMP2712]|uniref:GAF domain-containing protein n=1 Tax=Guillardia theta (strain CCMP2712) TaxID=905079 RepID=L1IV75_GUITC|nr:hypothetical protein GUITHDRAFT_114233 [Guillardia theta CCMP2712]EKX39735.1 hypothetical protein GUITHDRAFT_114233 [Guillardia theta CCMP2712]|eukprot:XP_005826715.1 hypothetical protein GUITHDRAFT_114233 [Guillardia theta CCMP2712]
MLLAFAALRDCEAMDLELLASSSLEVCVRVTLEQAMRASRASSGCFFLLEEPTSSLKVMGLPGESWTSPSISEDSLYPLSSSALLRKTIRVADHLASPLALSSSLPSAFPWWRHVRNSLCVPVICPGGAENAGGGRGGGRTAAAAAGLLGVLVMVNKKEAIFRGFDDVDAKVVAVAGRKLAMAMATVRGREEAQKKLKAQEALTSCCSDMLLLRDRRDLLQLVRARAGAVLECVSGGLLLLEEAPGSKLLLRTLVEKDESGALKEVTIHVPPFLFDSDAEEASKREAASKRGKKKGREEEKSRVGLWLKQEVAAHSLWLSGLMGSNASKGGGASAYFLAPHQEQGRLQALLLVQWQGRRRLEEDEERRISHLLAAAVTCSKAIAERDDERRRAAEEAARLRRSRELQEFVQQVVACSSAGEMRSVLQSAGKRLAQAVRVDIYSVREGGERLAWHDLERTGDGKELELLLPCDGLVGLAVSSRASVRVTEASSHPRFLQMVDQRSSRCRPRDMLCMPILACSSGRTGLPHGVIQLTNKVDGRSFDEEDERLVQELAEVAALVMEKEDMHSGRGRLLQALCRISDSLELTDVLKNLLAASWAWAGQMASEIEVWTCSPEQPEALVLAGKQEGGKEPCVKFKEEGKSWRVCKEEEILLAARQSKLSVSSLASDASVCYLNLPIRHGEQEEKRESRGLIRMRCREEAAQGVESSSLTLLATQAARAMKNAEAHGEANQTVQKDLLLFRRAEKISRCRSSLDLFKVTCAIASEAVGAEQVSLFAVDEEGRHIKEEVSAAGHVAQTSSPSYRLKHRVAILVLQAMNDSGSFLAEDVEEGEGGGRDGVVRKHCCGTPLWKSGGAGGGGGQSRGVELPLFGVLVCIRKEEEGAFAAHELAALNRLAILATDQIISIRDKATKLGQSLVLSMRAMQAKEPAAVYGKEEASSSSSSSLLPLRKLVKSEAAEEQKQRQPEALKEEEAGKKLKQTDLNDEELKEKDLEGQQAHQQELKEEKDQEQHLKQEQEQELEKDQEKEKEQKLKRQQEKEKEQEELKLEDLKVMQEPKKGNLVEEEQEEVKVEGEEMKEDEPQKQDLEEPRKDLEEPRKDLEELQEETSSAMTSSGEDSETVSSVNAKQKRRADRNERRAELTKMKEEKSLI